MEHQVRHHVAAALAAGPHRLAHGMLVGDRHHDHEGGPGAEHHLRLQVTGIYRLEIGHDRMLGEPVVQRAHRVQALGEDQRRARLEPVDARTHADLRGRDRLVQAREVERELHAGPAVEEAAAHTPPLRGAAPKCCASFARRNVTLSRRLAMPSSIVPPSPSSMLTQPSQPARASVPKMRS